MALQAGTPAPDFTLDAHSGAIKLSDLRGKTVVIGFHPASFTGG
ncbi:MAG: redoxin domain-containing protein [Chloroflexi bacterium]|nr:redoxin domain-containing protein [Chloroflexota bacterium]